MRERKENKTEQPLEVNRDTDLNENNKRGQYPDSNDVTVWGAVSIAISIAERKDNVCVVFIAGCSGFRRMTLMSLLLTCHERTIRDGSGTLAGCKLGVT